MEGLLVEDVLIYLFKAHADTISYIMWAMTSKTAYRWATSRPKVMIALPLALSSVGSRMTSILCLQSTPELFRKCTRHVFIEPYHVRIVVQRGELSILQCICEENFPKLLSHFSLDEAAIEAARSGQWHILKWLWFWTGKKICGGRLASHLLPLALESGNIPMIEWICFESPLMDPIFYPKVFPIAATCGHLHVLQWLHAKYPTMFRFGYRGIVAAAQKRGNPEMLQWLSELLQ